jgi:muramidase (phage lysozyme)
MLQKSLLKMIQSQAKKTHRKTRNLLRRAEKQFLQRAIVGMIGIIILAFLLINVFSNNRNPVEVASENPYPPLVMKGGDPYLRALMRTISASESNVSKPYHVIYGGKYVSDLSHHPDQCVKIETKPNKGKCTTAAGRYQFITTTWLETAKRYHPKPTRVLFFTEYSFAPQYQDDVVYAWLRDRAFWKVEIPQLLRDGKLHDVLKLLSGTWTSLGYGLENNSLTNSLPKVYIKMLQEEIKLAKE